MVVLSFFILIFLATDTALHHYQLGLSVDKVMTTLYGNEEIFEEPILFTTLLLQVHIDLFLSMFILLTLLAMFIRLYAKNKYTKIWIHLLFLSGLFTPLLLLLNYFLASKLGSIIWIILFIFWHLVAFYLCFKILWKLYTK